MDEVRARALRIVSASVFQFACKIALPCSFFASGIKVLQSYPAGVFLGNILQDSAMYRNMSFLIGFLIVFRTSQAYSRFWGGCTSVYQFMAAWSDGAASLVAFCKASKADEASVQQFQQTLVRLLSLLNALMLTELAQEDEDEANKVCCKFELLDVDGLDAASLKHVRETHRKIEVVFQWIQCLIVDNIASGVLSIPPPILTRCLQQFASGMCKYEDALKIVHVPLPFPYLAAIEVLLMVHWLISPFIVVGWTDTGLYFAPWSGVMCFIQVFFFWSLNATASELENPFGTDAEDLDTTGLQRELNHRLRIILHKSSNTTPHIAALPHEGDIPPPELVRMPDIQVVTPSLLTRQSCALSAFKTMHKVLSGSATSQQAVAPAVVGKACSDVAATLPIVALTPENFDIERGLGLKGTSAAELVLAEARRGEGNAVAPASVAPPAQQAKRKATPQLATRREPRELREPKLHDGLSPGRPSSTVEARAAARTVDRESFEASLPCPERSGRQLLQNTLARLPANRLCVLSVSDLAASAAVEAEDREMRQHQQADMVLCRGIGQQEDRNQTRSSSPTDSSSAQNAQQGSQRRNVPAGQQRFGGKIGQQGLEQKTLTADMYH